MRKGALHKVNAELVGDDAQRLNVLLKDTRKRMRGGATRQKEKMENGLEKIKESKG